MNCINIVYADNFIASSSPSTRLIKCALVNAIVWTVLPLVFAIYLRTCIFLNSVALAIQGLSILVVVSMTSRTPGLILKHVFRLDEGEQQGPRVRLYQRRYYT